MDIVSERVIVVERLLRHQLEYEMQYTFGGGGGISHTG
jgi:hypothetical protein